MGEGVALPRRVSFLSLPPPVVVPVRMAPLPFPPLPVPPPAPTRTTEAGWCPQGKAWEAEE